MRITSPVLVLLPLLLAACGTSTEPAADTLDWTTDSDVAVFETGDTSDTGDTTDFETTWSDDFLSNANPGSCDGSAWFYPLDSEAGWWNVSRLSPDQRDVQIDQIEYSLVDATIFSAGESGCALLDHRVRVFVGSDAPSADPTFVFEQEVTGLIRDGLTDGTPFIVTIDVPPIAVGADESLYILVETPVNVATGERICQPACYTPSDEVDRSFQTGSPIAPYSWPTLASFGIYNTSFAMWARIAE